MMWIWIGMLACSLPGGKADEHDSHDERDEHGSEVRVVQLTPEAMASARIVVSTAEEGALSNGLSLPARITLDPRREAIVSAWIAGQVDTISVRPGESVKKGQRKRSPAAPFTTSTFQQAANNRLGIGASKAMGAAQQLYDPGAADAVELWPDSLFTRREAASPRKRSSPLRLR